MLHSIACAFLLAGAGPPADDRLIADFEGKDYGLWKTTGTAFGTGPARGALPGQMPVSGFLGQGLVNSFVGGDAATGTLTSPPFKIERKFINFLIGGGNHPDETCVNLLVAGKRVRTATGPNDKPGGSEQLAWHSWDVSDLLGKEAVIEIVDRHTGGWGHVNVDHIVQGNRRRMASPQRRTLAITHRYLHLPVKTGAAMRRVKLVAAERTVRDFDIELADGKPDFWVFTDLSPFKGQEITIEAVLPADATVLERITQADALPQADTLYKEKRRPQFHFTARRGWLNDPNGLVYHDGEWHLFFQHNPYGWAWGNMHWGHAVSKDLMHWTELGEALYPRQHGDWCFSGSAWVQPLAVNAPGPTPRPRTQDVLALAFTSTGRGECIAFSHDRGRTWPEYPGNPVVKHRGRDPKVFWHAPSKHWVMAVYDEEKGKTIAFYTSPDTANWTLQSRIGEFFECPDLFELPVEGGDGKARKWVLYGADGQYVLGSFDGKRFTAEPGRHRLWHGPFYAAQTYNNAPAGRRVQIGWAQINFPGMPFNQQMTIPCTLSLRTTAEGVRMFALPVPEVDKFAVRAARHADFTVQPGKDFVAEPKGELLDIRAELEPQGAAKFGLTVRGVAVTYDTKKQTLTCGSHTAPLRLEDGKLRLRVLVDRGSVEVFGNDGRVALVVGVQVAAADTSVAVFAHGGTVMARRLDVGVLESAWPAK